MECLEQQSRLAQRRKTPAPPLRPGGPRDVYTVSGDAENSADFYHLPVLLRETVALLEPAPGKTIVDATLGGGGHTEALLAGGAGVIAIDQDPEAIARAEQRLQNPRLRLVHANFSSIGEVLDGLGVSSIEGALLDLGVSSHQLDTAARGFSFQQEGPLDMRMDPTRGASAADLVNNLDEGELIRIFREYGEEPSARRIAQQIVTSRREQPLQSTLELADLVESVSPRRGKRHPATKVFQALRIAVNRELELLPEALEAFVARLAPGGRLAVITFHSLEDRIVKRFFREISTQWLDRPEWPAPRPNPRYCAKLLNNKPITPSGEEQRENPRARSAKLRGVERIH